MENKYKNVDQFRSTEMISGRANRVCSTRTHRDTVVYESTLHRDREESSSFFVTESKKL